MTDPIDTDAIRARAEAATEGPWHVEDYNRNGHAPLVVGADMAVAETFDKPHLSDAAFIAHARTDVPALLAALDEARAERNEVAGRLSALLDHLTGGLMSKTNYPVPVMAQAIEAEFEKYAAEELTEAAERAEAAEAELAEARANAESEVREWKRHADGWEEAWRQENAERKAIETRLAEARAQVERVRALADEWDEVKGAESALAAVRTELEKVRNVQMAGWERAAEVEGVVQAVRSLLHLWESWDGTRPHPGESSPRQREQLRAALDPADTANERGE